ncbi:MAG: CPBP family intramembrane glutamic endopeptidase [Caryophanon sp.]|nr:CPBP family intramembrane glutamic endopeptidase [Caryophanon sp.]
MQKHYMLPSYGKNGWLRLLFFFLFSNIVMIASVLLFLLLVTTVSPTIEFIVDEADPRVISASPLVSFILEHIGLLIAFVALAFLTSWLLKRPWYTVLTSRNRFDFKKIGWAFGVFFIMLAAIQFVDYALHKDAYTLNIDGVGTFILFAILVVLLVPIQTTLEEFIYRGLGVQLVAKFTQQPFIIALVIGGIFGALHFGNPEMNMGALWIGLDYVFAGFFLTYMSVKFNATEYAIGAHAANNIFLYIFMTSDNVVGANLPSLFYVDMSDATFYSFFIYSVLFNVVFYLLVRWHAHRHRQSLSQHDTYL